MPLFALPAPKLGTRFYDGKNRKLVYILTELKDNRVHGQAADGAATQHKFWKIEEWEKMTGLTIGQDLLDAMIITPPPPPKTKAAKSAKAAKANKVTKPAKAAATQTATTPTTFDPRSLGTDRSANVPVLTPTTPPAPAPDPRDAVPAAIKEIAAASNGHIVICTTKPAPQPVTTVTAATAPAQPMLASGILKIAPAQIHCRPKLADAKEAERRAKLAKEIQQDGLKHPLWVYLFAPDPQIAFGGSPHGPLAQYELYEHDERIFRAVTEILHWTEIPVQLREGKPPTASAPEPPPPTPEPPTPPPPSEPPPTSPAATTLAPSTSSGQALADKSDRQLEKRLQELHKDLVGLNQAIETARDIEDFTGDSKPRSATKAKIDAAYAEEKAINAELAARRQPAPTPEATIPVPAAAPQATISASAPAATRLEVNQMSKTQIDAELQEYVAAGWQLIERTEYGSTLLRMVHEQDQIATAEACRPANLLRIMRGTLYKTHQEFVAWQQANSEPEPTPAPKPEPAPTVALSPDEIATQRKAAFGHWGWEQEYSDFFLAELAKGRPILWGCAPDALPTIHAWQREDGKDDHLGFGVFRIRSADFEAFFDAGGAMAHHGPISYTTVDVRKGVMPAWYDLATVRATLLQLKEQAKAFDAQLAAAQSAGAAEPPVTAATAPSAEQPGTELPAGATVETHAGIDFIFTPLVQPEPAAALTAPLPVAFSPPEANVANQPPAASQVVSITALPPATQDLAVLGAPPQHDNYDPGRVDLLFGLAPLADYKPCHYAHLGSSCTDFTPPPKTIDITIHQMLEQMRFHLSAPGRWQMVMRSVINATGGQGIIAYYNENDPLSHEASWFNTTTGLIHSGAFITWRANIPGFFRLHVAYEAGADTYTVRLWRAIDPQLNNGKVGELIREEDDVYCDMLDEVVDALYVAGCQQFNQDGIDLDTPKWIPLPNPQLPTRSSRAVTSRSKYN